MRDRRTWLNGIMKYRKGEVMKKLKVRINKVKEERMQINIVKKWRGEESRVMRQRGSQ